MATWSEQDPMIASTRSALTTRAARWATCQVGKHGRAVSEVADDLACDWHTVMDAVDLFGLVLIDDPARFGEVAAVGLDETLYKREGRYRRQCWSTQIVDVQHGQLLDVVAGREVHPVCAWFAARPAPWCDGVRWATLDLSSSYRVVFDTMLPDAVQVIGELAHRPVRERLTQLGRAGLGGLDDQRSVSRRDQAGTATRPLRVQ